MMKKTPSDFNHHDDWLAYVRHDVPVNEQPFALAFGRMELFRSFYRVRQIEFPRRFAEELERIEGLKNPERAAAMEALNDVIFSSLSAHLFDCALTAKPPDEAETPASPQEQIDQLLDHLAVENAYFALWLVYKGVAIVPPAAEDWRDYLVQEWGTESAEDIDFAQAMSELDKLLNCFRDRNLALPNLLIESIWFLHYLRGPERMAQTRAVLGTLLAELAECTSE
jgi:hypothetical protein